MKIFESNNTLEIEKNLRARFEISAENKIIVCSGLAHALAEVTRGLYSVYPHRTGLAYQCDGGPDLENMLPYFSREGFALQSLLSQDIKNPEGILTKLGKSGLFAAYSDDDPVTGELFESTELESKLNEAKVFCVRISYSSFLSENVPMTISPYSIRILSLSSGLAAVVLGARSNIDRLLFGSVYFDDLLVTQLPQLTKTMATDKTHILDFELSVAHFCKPFFAEQTPRLFDRAVICFNDADGSAVLDHSGLKAAHSTSLCRWGDVTSMEWLKRHGLTDEQIRGLVVLELAQLNDKTALSLEHGYKEVLKKQTGV